MQKIYQVELANDWRLRPCKHFLVATGPRLEATHATKKTLRRYRCLCFQIFWLFFGEGESKSQQLHPQGKISNWSNKEWADDIKAFEKSSNITNPFQHAVSLALDSIETWAELDPEWVELIHAWNLLRGPLAINAGF